MDLDLATQYTAHWEGRRSTVYRDTKGIPTIGVGFNLTTADAPAQIAALGLDYQSVLNGSAALTDAQMDQPKNGSHPANRGHVLRNLLGCRGMILATM